MPVFPPRPLLFVLTSHVLTFWPAGLVGRTARWLYLFVWTADGLACWLVVEISGLPVPHVVRLFIYPSVHDACLSFCLFFGLCHLCFSSTACQESSLCRHKKHFFPFSLHTSKFVISLSPFLLLFFLAQWWLRQSVGAGSAQGVNCLSSRIARDGRDPHLFGVGV